MELTTESTSFIISLGASVVGFADMTNVRSGTNCSLPRAISMGIAYDPNIIRRKEADQKSFHDHQVDIKKKCKKF